MKAVLHRAVPSPSRGTGSGKPNANVQDSPPPSLLHKGGGMPLRCMRESRDGGLDLGGDAS